MANDTEQILLETVERVVRDVSCFDLPAWVEASIRDLERAAAAVRAQSPAEGGRDKAPDWPHCKYDCGRLADFNGLECTPCHDRNGAPDGT